MKWKTNKQNRGPAIGHNMDAPGAYYVTEISYTQRKTFQKLA